MDRAQSPKALFHAGRWPSISSQLRCRLNTYAVWVDGESGTVLYGEIAPHVKPGQRVVAGEIVGVVLRVLRHDKGRPVSMLHLEYHTHGSREAPEWYDLANRPAVLRDPTPMLMTCL